MLTHSSMLSEKSMNRERTLVSRGENTKRPLTTMDDARCGGAWYDTDR